jgi:hypothetical protein
MAPAASTSAAAPLLIIAFAALGAPGRVPLVSR